MIQRVQSMWLFLAAVCAFLSIKLPFYSGTHINGMSSYALTGAENFLLLGNTIAVGILAVITIFLFKRRKLQIFLCVLGILLEGLLIFLYFRELVKFTAGTYALTAILHILIILFFVVAVRAIRKDQRLIEDSDRLR